MRATLPTGVEGAGLRSQAASVGRGLEEVSRPAAGRFQFEAAGLAVSLEQPLVARAPRFAQTTRKRRFGTELRRFLESAGMSAPTAATLLGADQTAISNIEAGRFRIRRSGKVA
ncbi:hypothetical protein GCM10009753_64880 [Streptantibioticus ferralitis]